MSGGRIKRRVSWRLGRKVEWTGLQLPLGIGETLVGFALQEHSTWHQNSYCFAIMQLF